MRGDAPVAENGCAGDAFNATEVRFEALQDDLPLAEKLADQQCNPAVRLRLDDDDQLF